MSTPFGELPIGARFCFRQHRYEKVTGEVGRDEERGGNLFHANTEVILMENEEGRMKNQRHLIQQEIAEEAEGQN